MQMTIIHNTGPISLLSLCRTSFSSFLHRKHICESRLTSLLLISRMDTTSLHCLHTCTVHRLRQRLFVINSSCRIRNQVKSIQLLTRDLGMRTRTYRLNDEWCRQNDDFRMIKMPLVNMHTINSSILMKLIV